MAYYLGPGPGALFGNAVANGAVAGFASGLIAGRGDLRAAISGAITGGIFGFIGDIGIGSNIYEKTALHAFGGCFSAAFGGGDCKSGALSAGFAEGLGTSGALGDWGKYGNIARNAVIGGTASVIGGGKFNNGAVTSAFGYLFNCMAHPGTCGGRKFSQAEIDESVTFGRYIAGRAMSSSLYPNESIPFYAVGNPSGYLQSTKYINYVIDFVGLGVSLRYPEVLISKFYGAYSDSNAIYNAYTKEDAFYLAGPLIGKAAGASMMTTTVSKENSLRYGTIYGVAVDAGLDKKQ